MSETKKSFFTIYDLGLKRKRWNCVTLSKHLSEEKNIELTPRSLQRYRTQEMRPQFAVAKAIFECLGIKATDAEISDSLEIAREEKTMSDTGITYLERGLRIRLSLLSDDEKDNQEIMNMLHRRIEETQAGSQANFNRYVTELIKYDLKHRVLPQVETGETTIEELLSSSD